MTDKSKAIPNKEEKFVPALRYRWATGLYDWLMETFVKEKELRRKTIAALHVSPRETVVDFGCGTGSLLRAIRRHTKNGTLVGFDLDKTVLDLAKQKFSDLPPGQTPSFFQVNLSTESIAEIDELPKANCLVSSLVFHHLTTRQKRQAFNNANLVLKPGGRFILVDWGPGATFLTKLGFLSVRLFDGIAVTRANAMGALPNLMADAGFEVTATRPLLNTVFGTIWLHEGLKT